MISRVTLFLSLILVGSGVASASEPPPATDEALYESLDDVTLGRLFMTDVERARIDAQRGRIHDEDGGAYEVEKTPAPEPADTPSRTVAAGYIETDGKRPLIWTDDGFRPGSRSSASLGNDRRVRIQRTKDVAEGGRVRKRADADPGS